MHNQHYDIKRGVISYIGCNIKFAKMYQGHVNSICQVRFFGLSNTMSLNKTGATWNITESSKLGTNIYLSIKRKQKLHTNLFQRWNS